MSMILMVKALQNKVGNPLRKLVLIKLADNANDQGECWPSFQHIADQCEISRRSVINHVNELESAGILKRIRRDGPKGNTSNLYLITIPSESLALPSESLALPPSESPAPRTSHSLEPVKEPFSKQVCPYDEIIEIYNKTMTAPFPKVRSIKSSARKRLTAKFYKLLKSDLENIEQYFTAFNRNATDHQRGANGWIADYDFIIRDTTIEKLNDLLGG